MHASRSDQKFVSPPKVSFEVAQNCYEALPKLTQKLTYLTASIILAIAVKWDYYMHLYLYAVLHCTVVHNI